MENHPWIFGRLHDNAFFRNSIAALIALRGNPSNHTHYRIFHSEQGYVGSGVGLELSALFKSRGI
jgi:hypothetical protein